jgi:hypothetical protein
MDKHSTQAKIQITDLINESVSHAIARRQKALESEEFEIDLSGDENQDYSYIKGGIQSITLPMPTIGYIYQHPEIE